MCQSSYFMFIWIEIKYLYVVWSLNLLMFNCLYMWQTGALILFFSSSRRASMSWTVESIVWSAAEEASQTKRRAPSSISPCQRRSGWRSSVFCRKKIKEIMVSGRYCSGASAAGLNWERILSMIICCSSAAVRAEWCSSCTKKTRTSRSFHSLTVKTIFGHRRNTINAASSNEQVLGFTKLRKFD